MNTKTTERFEKAVTKLYKAFHEGTLNAFSCKACAVGNIIEHGLWSGGFNSLISPYEIIIYGKNESGYSEKELTEIEFLFMCAHQEELETKEQQFKGLCAVVEYLAKLDNIPNPMDYSCLFETENDKPKYQLEEVKF